MVPARGSSFSTARVIKRITLVMLATVWINALVVSSGADEGTKVSSSETRSGAGSQITCIDLRPQFEKWGFTQLKQGGRGTCSVFALAGALEFASARKLGNCPRLSTEYLNWAANKTCGVDADGGFFSDLWNGFARYGICEAQYYPYQAAFDASAQPPMNALDDGKKRLALGLHLHWIKVWNVTTGLDPRQIDEIKATLRKGWPVCSGLRWPIQEQWNQGHLQMCTPDKVVDGHSILLVGYQDDPSHPDGGCFIFRNSGGDGRDGFMPYGYAQAYMNDAVWIDCP